ncbi:MAG: bifunctional ADP-heptose synthase [Anaerolineae bacterium]
MTKRRVDKDALLRALPRLRDLNILVLGDLFLDQYIVGRATRLSREAPVPVLEFDRRFHLPGGAANPAHNISALGSTAHQLGVIGDDDAGRSLVNLLHRAGIVTDGVVTDPARPTTTKTRVVAEGTLVFPQQLARIDQAERRPFDANVTAELVAHLRELAPSVDALLFSDYKTGVVNEETIATALRVARDHGKLITADSQGDLYKFKGFDLVKCNRPEAESQLGRELQADADFERAGEGLLADLGSSAIVVTRGDEGMSLISREEGTLHVPAANRTEVFDVTGAGDTVIAVMTLALAAGLTVTDGGHLANYAAGLVVRKLGNATPSQEELAWAIKNWPESGL